VHEGPQNISRRLVNVPLEPGMIVSNEPGYYKTGEYGIRVENLVAVIRGGTPRHGEREMLRFETLTLAPIDTRLVLTDMLSASELEWLNTYHARVRETLMPLVDDVTAEWLKTATAAIQ
ncbi:MAG: M24 family metallopeptidase C-terminal domain-containing protein, partial [Myxococcota bacterium]|nr:M24 family metallopeptidase C-terminal domain-containing protein [Myxococcota bacterium]